MTIDDQFHFRVTDIAVKKIIEFLQKGENKEYPYAIFRVKINTGGCSGFSYSTEISNAGEDDIFIDVEDRKIAIDQISWNFLKKTTLDYVDTITQSGFVFNNPDASSTCGCGISFDI